MVGLLITGDGIIGAGIMDGMEIIGDGITGMVLIGDGTIGAGIIGAGIMDGMEIIGDGDGTTGMDLIGAWVGTMVI
jgi:hypothetical protein